MLPKACRRRENGYHSISSAVAYNLGSHSPKKFYRQEFLLAPIIIALNAALPFLSIIILGHDAQIERIRRRLRNRYFKLVSLTDLAFENEVALIRVTIAVSIALKRCFGLEKECEWQKTLIT